MFEILENEDILLIKMFIAHSTSLAAVLSNSRSNNSFLQLKFSRKPVKRSIESFSLGEDFGEVKAELGVGHKSSLFGQC